MIFGNWRDHIIDVQNLVGIFIFFHEFEALGTQPYKTHGAQEDMTIRVLTLASPAVQWIVFKEYLIEDVHYNRQQRVPATLWVRILLSAEKDNLSPFDSKIACLCQITEIKNNMYIARARCECQTAMGSSGLNARWSWGRAVCTTMTWVQYFSDNGHWYICIYACM